MPYTHGSYRFWGFWGGGSYVTSDFATFTDLGYLGPQLAALDANDLVCQYVTSDSAHVDRNLNGGGWTSCLDLTAAKAAAGTSDLIYLIGMCADEAITGSIYTFWAKNGGTLYCIKSTDYGDNWTSTNVSSPIASHATSFPMRRRVGAINNNIILMAPKGTLDGNGNQIQTIAISDDGGATWYSTDAAYWDKRIPYQHDPILLADNDYGFCYPASEVPQEIMFKFTNGGIGALIGNSGISGWIASWTPDGLSRMNKFEIHQYLFPYLYYDPVYKIKQIIYATVTEGEFVQWGVDTKDVTIFHMPVAWNQGGMYWPVDYTGNLAVYLQADGTTDNPDWRSGQIPRQSSYTQNGFMVSSKDREAHMVFMPEIYLDNTIKPVYLSTDLGNSFSAIQGDLPNLLTLGSPRFGFYRAASPPTTGAYTYSVQMDQQTSTDSVPLEGDLATYDTLNYPNQHASDIEAGTATVHLPTGAASGEVPAWNGSAWVPTAVTSGHTIQDEGSNLPTRAKLNFVGSGVAATDDSGNNATVVTINTGATPHSLNWFVPGDLTVGVVTEVELLAPAAMTFTKLKARVSTAPTGASIIIDILQNGTSIWNINPANRPTITAGNKDATYTDPDTTSYSEDDVFTLEVIQIGASVAGANLMFHLEG